MDEQVGGYRPGSGGDGAQIAGAAARGQLYTDGMTSVGVNGFHGLNLFAQVEDIAWQQDGGLHSEDMVEYLVELVDLLTWFWEDVVLEETHKEVPSMEEANEMLKTGGGSRIDKWEDLQYKLGDDRKTAAVSCQWKDLIDKLQAHGCLH